MLTVEDEIREWRAWQDIESHRIPCSRCGTWMRWPRSMTEYTGWALCPACEQREAPTP